VMPFGGHWQIRTIWLRQDWVTPDGAVVSLSLPEGTILLRCERGGLEAPVVELLVAIPQEPEEEIL